MRRTPLKAGTKTRKRIVRSLTASHDEADLLAWKEPHQGYCECGCDPPAFAMHLERHHIVSLQHCKLEHGRLYDIRNSILLTPLHHARHTEAFRRIPISSIPAAAHEFAVELLGQDRADLYFARYYSSPRA